jgi:hypothetical protein
MNEELSDLPQAETADPDGVQVALRAAQTLWSRGDTTESLKWLRKAAESASDEGADLRSLQLAKAAAELRAKLFVSSESPRSSSAGSSGAGSSGAGEISGAHRIAHGSDSEGLRATGSLSNLAASPSSSAEAYSNGAAEEHGLLNSSRPVTATQYPSHRPRQRMGLSSSAPGPSLARDGRDSSAPQAGHSSAPSAVPSWSADSERRASSAPPPLPQASLDDYEELEAEPDEEHVMDDPGSVWSSGSDSWRPPEPAAESAIDSNPRARALLGAGVSMGSSVVPPPLPPRGAFADDDADFGHLADPPTVVIPPPEESEVEARANAVASSGSNGGARRSPASFGEQGNAWDQQARSPSWDPDPGSSWAAELRNATWGSPANIGSGSEPVSVEPPPPSETSPAKLTARVHHQAVRVSFAPDLRVPGQYVVRPLREGEKAASGERIALLVALEPGVPLV